MPQYKLTSANTVPKSLCDVTILSKIKHQNLNVDGLIYMSKIK